MVEPRQHLNNTGVVTMDERSKTNSVPDAFQCPPHKMVPGTTANKSYVCQKCGLHEIIPIKMMDEIDIENTNG